MTLKNLFKVNLLRGSLLLIIYLMYSYTGTAAAYLFRYALNALTHKDLITFLYWCSVEILVAIVSSLFLTISTYLFNKQIQQYVHVLRDRIIHHYYHNSDREVGEIQNILNNNMKILTDEYARPWILILSSSLMLLMSIGVLFSMHWTLVIATVLTCVIVLALPQLTQKITTRATKAASQKNAVFLKTVADWFSGLNVLRRYHAINRLQNVLNQSSGRLADANEKKQKALSTADGLNGVGNSIGQVGIILWGGLLFFHHQLDIGGLLVASNFVSSIFDELWDIIDSITQIKATKDLRTELHTLTQDTETDTEVDASPAAISVKGLVITYEGHQIRYPDFAIRACDKVLLSGDSGTGKSTLLKAILGKLQPTAGSIEYYNKKGELITPNYRQIGYVAQDGVLFPDTIANNMTMFQHYPESQLNKVIDSVELTDDLTKFPQGVNTTINLDNLNVSGGQQQKIILARAKLKRQNLLLLDEPTSAIDSKTSTKIIKSLLASDQTIIMIGHNLRPEVQKLFDYRINLSR
ncbi:ABC transporter ATP-binding protein [Lactobacillus sp. ESL0236]|uniref:ATP-binding cassette domain-containing protein n=1 Tax=unclassified Lactobacillus TaxID=2620435 RepID=UPI000EFA8449|nr:MULTISPECIES: ABC transporter ATP-binding protein [unclassified Lactobacillus]RMC39935.1 ABC transporter ATP-binding protein [Lactobacillus sp. ESL0237]RMC44094.1 ABC transporter ATP-binding protein [Lactobacillus sp. ESL0234]RMC45423.1 ABC transporter ATP-binding protein [Lactobacillus sp. ESL0236]